MTNGRGSDYHRAWNKVVGNNVRIERSNLGLTQEAVANAMGISYQQVQKYETGMNRISCGRLYELAKFLNVPVGQFYMGCTGGDELAMGTEPQDTVDLVDHFSSIDDLALKAALSGLVKALKNSE